MTQVKLFYTTGTVNLERDINYFLEKQYENKLLEKVLDIKYTRTDGGVYTAMVIYNIKTN